MLLVPCGVADGTDTGASTFFSRRRQSGHPTGVAGGIVLHMVAHCGSCGLRTKRRKARVGGLGQLRSLTHSLRGGPRALRQRLGHPRKRRRRFRDLRLSTKLEPVSRSSCLARCGLKLCRQLRWLGIRFPDAAEGQGLSARRTERTNHQKSTIARNCRKRPQEDEGPSPGDVASGAGMDQDELRTCATASRSRSSPPPSRVSLPVFWPGSWLRFPTLPRARRRRPPSPT
jgi:hypothetical protein